MDKNKKAQIIVKSRQIRILLDEIIELLENGDVNLWDDLRMADTAAMNINNKVTLFTD